jgi:hypothetical protein
MSQVTQERELGSALTVRFGILGAAVLGGFIGHCVEILNAPAGEAEMGWPTIAGIGAGLIIGWVVLTWLARRYRVAGIVAGGILTIAAVMILVFRFAWQRFG